MWGQDRNRTLWSLLVVVLAAGAARGEVSTADRTLLHKVSAKLVAATDPVAGCAWPPEFEVVDEDRVNAAAGLKPEGDGPDARPRPRVVVYAGMMRRVVQGSADRLAYVVGHELGHVVLRHVFRPTPGATPLLRNVFGRDQENAADLKGMELALKAGYSYRRALTAIHRMLELGVDYTSFEGLGADHPSWRDRLANLDKDQAQLWKTASAFHDGAYFLALEQYASAERCFQEVAREFPRCYEAWNNVGFARLMRYCDGLDADDLRSFDVGLILVGGFYRRPASLEETARGRDEKLWTEAVADLREALRLRPDLVLARANLGVAYLVRPAGKDVAQAARYLHEAAEKATEDKGLDPSSRAAVAVNAAVADLAGGRVEAGALSLDRGEQLGRPFAGELPRPVVGQGLANALRYNRALVLASSREAEKRREAANLLEQYLKNANPTSAWWPLGYERYARLCRELGTSPREKTALASPARARFRPVTSVALGPGMNLALNEPMDGVRERLGMGESVNVVAAVKLARTRYPAHGAEVLGTDRVLVIRLRGPAAPPVIIRGTGLGAEVTQVRIGMMKVDFEKVLGGEDYDFRQIDEPSVNFRFYTGLGLAVRITGGKVQELAVAQIPRRQGLEGP